jgi:hypothetical protein
MKSSADIRVLKFLCFIYSLKEWRAGEGLVLQIGGEKEQSEAEEARQEIADLEVLVIVTGLLIDMAAATLRSAETADRPDETALGNLLRVHPQPRIEVVMSDFLQHKALLRALPKTDLAPHATRTMTAATSLPHFQSHHCRLPTQRFLSEAATGTNGSVPPNVAESLRWTSIGSTTASTAMRP